jgi:hypothetical protein
MRIMNQKKKKSVTLLEVTLTRFPQSLRRPHNHHSIRQNMRPILPCLRYPRQRKCGHRHSNRLSCFVWHPVSAAKKKCCNCRTHHLVGHRSPTLTPGMFPDLPSNESWSAVSYKPLFRSSARLVTRRKMSTCEGNILFRLTFSPSCKKDSRQCDHILIFGLVYKVRVHPSTGDYIWSISRAIARKSISQHIINHNRVFHRCDSPASAPPSCSAS